jgi:hypothetical protein
MYALNGGGEWQDLFTPASNSLGGGHSQYRANPLTSGKDAVTHGFVQLCWNRALAWEHLVKGFVNKVSPN